MYYLWMSFHDCSSVHSDGRIISINGEIEVHISIKVHSCIGNNLLPI